MTFAMIGIVILVLESLQLAGVLGSASIFPPALAIGLPVFWLLAFLWKTSAADWPAVIVAASTFFLQLNRTTLALDQLAAPLIGFGSIYLVYFGFTRGIRRSEPARPTNGTWLLLSVLLVLAILAVIVGGPLLP